jgi:hypothetical protein
MENTEREKKTKKKPKKNCGPFGASEGLHELSTDESQARINMGITLSGAIRVSSH